MRKDWTTFFINLAHTYSQQSTCASGRRVGCIIARGNRQISAGFNGVPPKVEHPEICERLILKVPSGGGLNICECHHAEHNAIEFARQNGIDIVGADMYVTSQPCGLCAPKIAEAKLARVFYDVPYPGSDSAEALVSNGIVCEPYHNEVLRGLDMTAQCEYLLELVKEERGLDKIAKLIGALPSGEEAERYAFCLVNESRVFGSNFVHVELEKVACKRKVVVVYNWQRIEINQKQVFIPRLKCSA